MTEGMEASFCSCDYEVYEWFVSREYTARKEHRCCECGEKINPGERYERAVGKMDGFLWHHKTCSVCVRIRRDFCAPYEGLRETIWEALGVDYMGEWKWDDDDD